MSDLGDSQHDGAPMPGAPGPDGPSGDASGGAPADVPIWLLTAVAAVIALLAAVFVVALTHQKSGASAESPDSPYPTQWDARIAPYADKAEQLRGLYFKHPIEVRFLPPAKFEKTVTADEKELDGEDRQEIEHFTGLMRAFGLLTGDVDVFKAVNTFQGAGILAYYSFDDERITVRGNKITPSVRSTLVHELTHALQDQNFDVGDRMKKLRKASKDGPSTSASSVLDAIIEGDAKRVETLYRNSLTPRQQKALDAGQRKETAEAMPRIKRVPQVISTMLYSPYLLGQALVMAADADGGNAAVDDLFRNSPTHESALLDPFETLVGHTGALDVATPTLHSGEKRFDSGEFGVITWYLMLAERMPLQNALAAADGWGGDAYVGYEDHGRSCARMVYRGKTSSDTGRMYAALQRWVAAGPNHRASVSRDGAGVHLQSCDPGTSARIGKDASQQALTLATTRTYIGVGFMKAGLPATKARCMAGRISQAFPLSQLVNPTFGANNPAIQDRVRQLVAGCV